MSTFLGIILGIIAFACLYLGKGLQKYAIVGYQKKATTLGEKGKNIWIWIAGLCLTGSFLFIHWVALKFALISVIAPMEGLGLIILCFFSYFVLKESIDRIKTYGIIFILVGLVLTTIFMPSPEEIPLYFDNTLFIIFLSVVMGIFLLLTLYTKLSNWRAVGVILGSFAGAFMCFQTLTKRISWMPGFEFHTFIMFLFAGATLIMTNIAFIKADAVIVVPSFTSMSITLPTIFAIFLFREPVVPLQWVGIIIIVFGVILLTAFSAGGEPENSKEI
ncbi:MAG: hypothetical protein HWN65_00170 [Candidatus Helarchaeota archaeon]|nr:hypothetical protein [Candidatus Helarchaeota archaeon]